MKKLRAGVIGLGVGQKHAESYQQHPNCELAVICDFDAQRLQEVQQHFPDTRVTLKPEDVLTDPHIDIVSIASYDQHHFEQIMLALEHDKHVFVEKPVVLFRDHAAAIRAALRKKPHLQLSSNLIMRCYPRFTALKERIDQGELGQLYHVEADYNYGRLEKITNGWRGQLDFYSVIYGGGVHIIDLLLWLTGDRVIEVAAFGNNLASQGTNFRFNDMVVGILQFESGMTGKISANFGCVFPHFHAVNLYGTRSTFVNAFDYGLLYTSRSRAEAPQKLDAPYPGVDKGELLLQFIDAIIAGNEPPVSIEAVMDTMSVCFCLEMAVQQSCKIKVEYL